MDAEKMQIVLGKDCPKAELVIREVKSIVEDKLPVQEPDNVDIKGTISAIANFLEKRWNVNGQIDHAHTHILLDRDNLKMTLVCNETDKRYKMQVVGTIEVSRQYKQFHINDYNEAWEPIQLGNFFRINSTYFENYEVCADLVMKLKKFTADVKSHVDKHKDDNGSVTFSYAQAVDSNLPKAFVINIPIFKGSQPEKITINTDASVDGTKVLFYLISSDAAAIYETARDKVIDKELDRIKEIAPEIPIIEQ